MRLMDSQSAAFPLLRSQVLRAARLVIVVATSLCACGDDDGAIDSSVMHRDDGGPDAGQSTLPTEDDDGGEPPARCDRDSDCFDDRVCNGEERCIEHVCRDGDPKQCSELHPCRENLGGCDCRTPSSDEDAFPAPECPIPGIKADCDDSRSDIFPGATEICDADGVDEDCDAATVNNPRVGGLGHGDADEDGFVSRGCFNFDARRVMIKGNDCDDSNPLINQDAVEECDYVDNDCDDDVDEDRDAPRDTLRVEMFPDADGDGFPARNGEPIFACAGPHQPPGIAPATEAHDCNDDDPKTNVSALELCDGEDNDCDDLVDAADDDLFAEFDQASTEFACVDGRWSIVACPIDRLWCTPEVVQFGCTIDATSLDNCRECGNLCGFACGLEGCDDVESVALGDAVTCARTQEGNVACWGWGDAGRLGNGSERSSFEPLQVDLFDAQLLAAGAANGCAVLGDTRELQCWGNNEDGVLGTGDLNRLIDPDPGRVVGGYGEPAMVGVVSVGIGPSHACAAIDSGEAFCWGNTAFGRLGNNVSEEDILAPRPVQRVPGVAIDDAQSVVAGERHGCLLTTSGSVECWGSNTAGQLGDPVFAEELSARARRVPGLTASQIDAGSRHTCALSAGQVLCWGSNGNLQLGRDDVDFSAEPAVVAGLSGVTQIAVGGKVSCALDNVGAVWCWGVNELGERGDDDPGDRATPGLVLSEGVITIAAGDFNVCAVNEEREIYCWGDNYYGQLGTGKTDELPQSLPQLVKPLKRR